MHAPVSVCECCIALSLSLSPPGCVGRWVQMVAHTLDACACCSVSVKCSAGHTHRRVHVHLVVLLTGCGRHPLHVLDELLQQRTYSSHNKTVSPGLTTMFCNTYNCHKVTLIA